MLFHQTFLTILRGQDELQYNTSRILPIEIDTLPKNTETILKVAPVMLEGVKREQELLETNKEYYVAKDISTNTYYMCYKDVLMIDIDLHKTSDELTELDVTRHFSNIPGHCFKIYKSKNGYHVFCLSHRYSYRKEETIEFMLNNFSDFYYTVYAYIRGWSVRLNKKFNEIDSMYKCLGVFGDIHCRDLDIERLVDKHIQYVKRFDTTNNIQ